MKWVGRIETLKAKRASPTWDSGEGWQAAIRKLSPKDKNCPLNYWLTKNGAKV